MKRLFALSLMLLVLSVPVLAGDTDSPGKNPPPPCTQNCGSALTLTQRVVLLLLGLR